MERVTTYLELVTALETRREIYLKNPQITTSQYVHEIESLIKIFRMRFPDV